MKSKVLNRAVLLIALLFYSSCEKPESSIIQEIEIIYVDRCFVVKNSVTNQPIYNVEVFIGWNCGWGGQSDIGFTDVNGNICFKIEEDFVNSLCHISCKAEGYQNKEIISPSKDLEEILLEPNN